MVTPANIAIMITVHSIGRRHSKRSTPKTKFGGCDGRNPMTASQMNPELFKKIQNEGRERKRRQHPTRRTNPFIALTTMYMIVINKF